MKLHSSDPGTSPQGILEDLDVRSNSNLAPTKFCMPNQSIRFKGERDSCYEFHASLCLFLGRCSRHLHADSVEVGGSCLNGPVFWSDLLEI